LIELIANVVGDIHGDIDKIRAFLGYKPDELHIALIEKQDRHWYRQVFKGTIMKRLFHFQIHLTPDNIQTGVK